MSTERKRNFACFGDSITSDQVTGTGTRVAELLDCNITGNFACGYATMSDWHEGEKNITPVTLSVPQDTNTADNVLSNQVRRCLYATGAPERVLPAGLKPFFSENGACRTGTTEWGISEKAPAPDILYIAAGINDGNHPCNRVTDDVESVLRQEYGELTRNSMASALRWAIETLRAAYPTALVFAASPLYTWGSGFDHMTREAVLQKRDIVRRIAEYESVHFIDSTFRSGFSEQIAERNGGVHPNEIWKEQIARFVAAEIRRYL